MSFLIIHHWARAATKWDPRSGSNRTGTPATKWRDGMEKQARNQWLRKIKKQGWPEEIQYIVLKVIVQV